MSPVRETDRGVRSAADLNTAYRSTEFGAARWYTRFPDCVKPMR
jgi:hypothetical protein